MNKNTIIAHKIEDSDIVLYFGTHRNSESIFQKNIFANYKPNAYKYSESEANSVLKELESVGWKNLLLVQV